MSSKAVSSSAGYDSSREDLEDCPLDLLSVSGLESIRSRTRRNCPQCGVYLPAAVEEIVQLKEKLEFVEAKSRRQCESRFKQSSFCRNMEENVQELKQECEKLKLKYKEAETENAVLLMKLEEWNNQQEARSVESNAEWKEKAKTFLQTCEDLVERLQDGEQSWMRTREECKRLRDVLAKAFCKSKLTATEMDKVIVQQIPNDQEHIRTWVDFLNPLEMPQSMLSSEGMSPDDARGNVCHVLLAWLEGKGGPGKPRTWGTLLDAMHRGPQYLQELANRAEYILLEELASLKMEFHVCVMCRRKILQDPTEEASNSQTAAGVDGWVVDGVECV